MKGKREHLVENAHGFDRSLYKKIDANAKGYEKVTESAHRLFVELNKEKLTESSQKAYSRLQEGISDSRVLNNCVAELKEQGLTVPVLWKFPVSRVNTVDEPNINGRVYEDSLWENVLNNQRQIWVGQTGLANHPTDDGDVMNQSVVWLDAIKEDGIIYGVGALVGDGGKLMEQIMSVGGKCGFSTAGYGEVLENGIVDPNTYEIERLADWVLNPSQGVYGNAADRVAANNSVKESVEKENTMKKAVKESAKKAKDLFEDEEAEDQNEDENAESEEGSEDETTDESTESEDTSDEGESSDESNEETESGDEGSDETTDESEGSEGEESTEEGSDETASEDSENSDDGEDEEETLSESLIRKHYLEKINQITKLPGRQWESKISQLEKVVRLANKEDLSEKAKKAISDKVKGLVEGIMKETSKIIATGYDAKEVCESIGISNIKVLEGVQNKMEDFASIQECLTKEKKASAKYKGLYEEEQAKVSEYAKASFKAETSLKEAVRKASVATKLITEKNAKIHALEDDNARLTKKANAYLKRCQEYEKLLKQYEATTKVLERKNRVSEKTNSRLEAKNRAHLEEQRAYENSITNFEARDEENSFLRETKSINELFESAGKNVKDASKLKTRREAENALIFGEDITESRVPTKRDASDSVESLSDLFGDN